MPLGTSNDQVRHERAQSSIDLQGLMTTLRQGSQDNSTSEEYRQAMRQCVTIFDGMNSQIQQWINQGNYSSLAARAGTGGSDGQKQGQQSQSQQGHQGASSS